MSNDQVWDDEARSDLRATIQMFVLGQTRLAKREKDDILDACRDIYLVDECPDDEQPEFLRYAADQLQHAQATLEAERESWPAETDCDRLDRVEATLRDRGILLWQASPCCDTCSRAELGGRLEVIESRHPGLRKRLRGYAFFIDQNLPESLSDGTEIDLYLAYGWLSPDNTDVDAQQYEQRSLAIGREVSECLQNEGFEVNWDGSFSHKIGLTVNWQRRTLLQ